MRNFANAHNNSENIKSNLAMMNILIIEDDQRIAELIQRGLEEQGFVTALALAILSGNKLFNK